MNDNDFDINSIEELADFHGCLCACRTGCPCPTTLDSTYVSYSIANSQTLIRLSKVYGLQVLPYA